MLARIVFGVLFSSLLSTTGNADAFSQAQDVRLPFVATMNLEEFAVGKLAASLRAEKHNFEETLLWWEDVTVTVAEQIEFKLYTRANPDKPEFITLNDTEPLKYFEPRKRTKMYIHGWNSDETFGEKFREAYLDSNFPEAVNYIEMSYNGASSLNYGVFRARVPEIGRALAGILDMLAKKYRLDLGDVHLLGYSSGAHIAGEAGRLVTDGTIGRITGLDPAGPLFSEENTRDRLSPNTAKLVDVIHTCSNQLGLDLPMGHVDFYPNEGVSVQPGCLFLDFFIGLCSHRRAVYFYLESITNKEPFRSRRCKGRGGEAHMGEYVDPRSRGLYCLQTNDDTPFALPRISGINKTQNR